MKEILDLEQTRLEKQLELDSQRDMVSRNKLGQFATPTELARDIARVALSYLDSSKAPVSFLEPSVGSGSFFFALLSELSMPIRRATGVELDERFANLASSLWANQGLNIIRGDFTELVPSTSLKGEFDLILANPPYVRHHHIGTDKKKELQRMVYDELGLKCSGLAGLYVYFILFADKWLRDDAVSAWLVPTEWMDVNYGRVLKEYLLRHTQMLRVHKFQTDDEKFQDATVSSSVIFFKKVKGIVNSSCIFSFGSSLAVPSKTFVVAQREMKPEEKWSVFFRVPSIGKKIMDPTTIKFGDVFDVRRGIATGGNSYFVRRYSDFQQMGIPDEFLKPVIPPIKKIKNPLRIIGDTFGYPEHEEKFAIFSTSLPEDVIREKYHNVWEFLNSAEAVETRKGYLVSHRSPWYSQETRTKPDMFVTYMGRSRNERQPFTFILNESDAVATNTYLLVSLKKQYQDLRQGGWLEAIVNFLNSKDANLTSYGRLYGGGLWKIEPKELEQVDLSSVLDKNVLESHHRQLHLFAYAKV